MKQVEVTILGQGYILACPEGGEARLAAAVASVDREMSAIRDAGKVRARERIAVLAALNLAYQAADRTGPSRGDAPAPSGPSDGHEGAIRREHDDDRVAALVARLDTALGDDGHLI